jgi:hypothetical protein
VSRELRDRLEALQVELREQFKSIYAGTRPE